MALTTVKLAFGPWEPDAAKLGGSHTCTVRNAVPSASGWRPFHAPSPLRHAPLGRRVLEAFARRDGEAILTLAATADGIFALEGGSWVGRWQGAALSDVRGFADFGSALYALYGTRLLRSEVRAGTAQDFAPVEGAPHGSALGVVHDFLVVGRLTDAENAVRWSGLDRPDEWPEPGSDEAQFVQSDTQVFPTGGRVQAVLGGVGAADGLIFLESAVHRASYVGAPYIFRFEQLDRRRGLLAPKSAVLCGGLCCFLSADGWFATDGNALRPIGLERVDRWFFENADAARLAETRGVYDAQNRTALWTFASPTAAHGVHDRALIYSCELDRWGCAAFESEALFCDWTRGLTLEELDGFGTLDELPFASLDAASLKHGRLGVFVFDAGHRLCSLEGAALEAVFDTPEHGEGRFFLHGFRPLADGGSPEVMPVWRDRVQDVRRFGRWSRAGRDGLCPHRLSARRLSARLRMGAGQEWSCAVGVEAVVEREDVRSRRT